MVFTIHQLAHFFILDLEKDLEKYQSKLVVVTGDLYLHSDSQISKLDKDWRDLQMIQAIKKQSKSNQKVYCKFYYSCLLSYKTV